ncbi:MAG: glycosidase [Promethearchaeota archaeon]
MTSKRPIFFQRHQSNPILTADDFPYSIHAVYSPAATLLPNGDTLLLVTCEDFRGFTHLTIARSKDGISNWKIDSIPVVASDGESLVKPTEGDYFGCKDPRITWLKELKVWGITYVASSRIGPQISLLTTPDFKAFKQFGCIMPPHNKDAALFPHRFKGKWVLINRPTYGNKANLWLSFSPDLRQWGDHQTIIKARRGGWWDALKIGLGPPPLETEAGWLILYHGVKETASGKIYRTGIALLDKEDPRTLLHRADDWVFGPRECYERKGNCDDKVFPCGWVYTQGMLRLYYGAADTVIACAIADLDSLVNYVLQYISSFS